MSVGNEKNNNYALKMKRFALKTADFIGKTELIKKSVAD